MSSRFLLVWAGRLLGGLALAGAGLLAPGPAQGQAAPAPADSLALRQRFARYQARTPVEKLYLRPDRPAYVSGETMWFKINAVEGTTQQPLAASTLAYVEVLNPAQEPVLQAKITLREARGQGSLVLPAALASGQYTVRAYTSWMKNFGPAFYFQTAVTVVNTRQPLGLPLRPPAAAYDPQFFPEGGYLVQGLTSSVGFKLTDAAGRGVGAEVDVLDAAGASVARCRTLWAGLGSFTLTPAQAGAAYRAVIRLTTGETLTQALPPVRAQGYALHLEDTDSQQLRLVVQAQDLPTAETVYLLGHAGARVLLVAETRIRSGQVEFSVPRSQLAGGVSHFTLFNSQHQPLCERLYFSPPAAPLVLAAKTDRAAYPPRAPVALQLAAAGPLPADLSVAVYQLDSLSASGGADITSYLWLTADLRGPVENPGRYFAATPDAARAADNLMLTQGWSRFQWADVLAAQPAPATLPHLPELHGHLVQGRVVDSRTGAPAPGVVAYLAAPGRRVQLATAVSQPDGRVQFELPGLVGPRQLVAQCERGDSLHRVELFSAFAPPPAPAPAAPLPPAFSAERLAASLLRRHVQADVALALRRAAGRLRGAPAGRQWGLLRPAARALFARQLHPLQGAGRSAARVRAGRAGAHPQGWLSLSGARLPGPRNDGKPAGAARRRAHLQPQPPDGLRPPESAAARRYHQPLLPGAGAAQWPGELPHLPRRFGRLPARCASPAFGV